MKAEPLVLKKAGQMVEKLAVMLVELKVADLVERLEVYLAVMSVLLLVVCLVEV